MNFPESFITRIEQVCRSPGLFGIDSFKELIAFIQGWLDGADVHSDLFEEFQLWITEKYKEPPANHWTFVLYEKIGNESLSRILSIFKEFNHRCTKFDT